MSDHHGKTGDQAAAVDTASYEGYVYVATNPAMPNLVKIGSTTQDDPQSRITSLFTTSVPVPFELEYAAAIADDPVRVERALHRAFEPQRLHPKREFFKVEPYQVIAILKLLDVADITEQAKSDVEAEISQEDRDALELARRRPTLNFDELEMPEGSILTYLRDERVRAEVVDDRRVRLIELPDNEYPPSSSTTSRGTFRRSHETFSEWHVMYTPPGTGELRTDDRSLRSTTRSTAQGNSTPPCIAPGARARPLGPPTAGC